MTSTWTGRRMSFSISASGFRAEPVNLALRSGRGRVRVVGPVAVDGGRGVGVQGELLDVQPVRIGSRLPRQRAAQDQQVGDNVGTDLAMGA
jgi:hypothetical protein